MWALDGRYVPQRKREKALVVVSSPLNPCTVIALNGRVIAHIGDTGEDEPTARNATVSICQYVVDAMAVADLWPYTFVVEGWRSAPHNESTIQMLQEDFTEGYFYHPVFEALESEEYSVFFDGSYRFSDFIYDNVDILIDVNFRKSMFFISSAMRYPDHTSAFCIQAVEAIRAAFGDGSDSAGRRRAWQKMHQSLGTEVFSKAVSAPEFQSEKHGMSIPRSWVERAKVLAPAIEVAYRYGLYWRKTKDLAAVRSGLPQPRPSSSKNP